MTMGIAMIGAEPSIVKINSFGVYFFDQRVVGFAVDGNPISYHQPMSFDFPSYLGQAGFLFVLKFNPMFFKNSFQVSVGSARFGGFGFPDDFVKSLFLAKSVQN